MKENDLNFQESNKNWWHGIQSYYSKTIRQTLKKGALPTATLFCIVLFVGAFVAIRWVDVSIFVGASSRNTFSASKNVTAEPRLEYKLTCSDENTTQTCPSNYPKIIDTNDSLSEECPEYLRWIYEDLRPWKRTGITKEIVDSGIHVANIRIVVVDGKVYVEKYKGCFQTRDVFTVWGILQLLKFYPGKLPDLDFMFACGDRPVIMKRDYMGVNASIPPPMFHYCADDSSLDLVFPDWSFWGWPEVHIKPWVSLKDELEDGNRRTNWTEREPYAYWKGNARVSAGRRDLMKCKVTDVQDWNARLYNLDWIAESKKGFQQTNLADQCTHRYKIYAEGVAWSVSEKYILACDSMSLLVKPQFYDFFTRSLQPLVHYWPISNKAKCRSVKFAVDWGNSNTKKAQEIGRAGSRFIHEGLKMKNVYDYMFHSLNEYAKLMNYKPEIPPGAMEVCSEMMACKEPNEINKKFKIESMVKGPSDSSPCILPPPYTRKDLRDSIDKKESIRKQVEMWERHENPSNVKF